MISTIEYQERYQPIIEGIESSEDASTAGCVCLVDGYKRYIHRDGDVGITIIKPDGTSAIDADFTLETALMKQTNTKPLIDTKEKYSPNGEYLTHHGATTAISNDTKALITSGISKSTLRNYRYWSREIETWLAGQTLTDALLAAYITELHQAGKAPATISQAVAAAKWIAKHQGIVLADEVTRSTLAGIRRAGKDRGRGQVDGLTWHDVERVCAFAELDGTLIGLRDSALIRLMSDCMLRISEAVAVDVEDLKNKTLTVASSKTDQEGKGESLYVTGDTRRAIKRYCKEAEITSGPLFRSTRRGGHITQQRLSSRSARVQISYWAHDAGVKGIISGHSLRIGSAVSLARAGASLVEMQVAGRWKESRMPAHYAKAELAERSAIARFKEK